LLAAGRNGCAVSLAGFVPRTMCGAWPRQTPPRCRFAASRLVPSPPREACPSGLLPGLIPKPCPSVLSPAPWPQPSCKKTAREDCSPRAGLDGPLCYEAPCHGRHGGLFLNPLFFYSVIKFKAIIPSRTTHYLTIFLPKTVRYSIL
jgi:hypothetical protein